MLVGLATVASRASWNWNGPRRARALWKTGGKASRAARMGPFSHELIWAAGGQRAMVGPEALAMQHQSGAQTEVVRRGLG